MSNRPQLTPKERIIIVGVLLTGSFIAILNQTLMVTALPPIMEDLHVEAPKAQWLTSSFMLMNGIMIPITAFLIEKFTTRHLFIGAMTLFAFGTVIGAVAPDFPVLLSGRIVQAAAGGILLPLMQTVLFLIFPVNRRGTAMGVAGLVIAFAPALGPTLSGWITDHYTWRFIFYLLLPVAFLDIALAWWQLKNVTELLNPKIDILSIALSSIGFGGLLYGCSIAGSHGWGSNTVIIPIAVGLVALFLFVRRQFRLKTPMLEFRVFKNFIFTLATVITMIAFPLLIGVETLIPLYVQNVRGLSAMQSGLVMLPGAVLMGLLSPVCGKIYDKFDARGLAITGLTLMSAGTIPFVALEESTSLIFLASVFSARMVGISMVIMPLTAAALNQLNQHLVPHGNAVMNTMRQVAGSIGTAVFITIMSITADGGGPDADVSPAALLQGINTAFFASLLLSFVGIFLCFFVRKTLPQTPVSDEERDEGS